MDDKDQVKLDIELIEERTEIILASARAIADAYRDDPDEADSILVRVWHALDILVMYMGHEEDTAKGRA